MADFVITVWRVSYVNTLVRGVATEDEAKKLYFSGEDPNSQLIFGDEEIQDEELVSVRRDRK